MVIVGYYAHGNKQYVTFNENEERPDRFMITDGFHDRPVNERNAGKYKGYVKIEKSECDLKKIRNANRAAIRRSKCLLSQTQIARQDSQERVLKYFPYRI